MNHESFEYNMKINVWITTIHLECEIETGFNRNNTNNI